MITVLGTLGNDIFNISNNASGDRYYGRAGNDIFNVKSVNGLFINTDDGNDIVTLQGNGNVIDSLWVGLEYSNFEYSSGLDRSTTDKITIRGNDNTINGVNIKLNLTGDSNSIGTIGVTKASVFGNNNILKNSTSFGLYSLTQDPDDITFNGNYNQATVDPLSTILIKGSNNNISGSGLKVFSTGDSNVFMLDYYDRLANGGNYNFDNVNNVSLRGNDNYVSSMLNKVQGRITGNNNEFISGLGEDNLTITGNNNSIVTELQNGSPYRLVASSGDKIAVTGNDNFINADEGGSFFGDDLRGNPDKLSIIGDRNTILGTLDDTITIRGNDNQIHLGGRFNLLSTEPSPIGSLLVKVLNASASNSLFLDFNYGNGETITLQKQGASLLLHVEDGASLVSETLKITNQFVASGLFGVDSITSADGFTIDLRGTSFIASASTVPSEWDASFWHSVV